MSQRLIGGKLYKGGTCDTQPDGNGVLTYPNGFSFDGSFYEGTAISGVVRDNHNRLLNGYHEFTYLGGDYYAGDYVKGQRSGFGKLVMTSNQQYEGSFLDDHIHGIMLYTDSDGKKFEEEWCRGCEISEPNYDQITATDEQLYAAQQRREVAEIRWESIKVDANIKEKIMLNQCIIRQQMNERIKLRRETCMSQFSAMCITLKNVMEV